MLLGKLVDRSGAVEFPFAPWIVFHAVKIAVGSARDMTIVQENAVAGRLVLKAGASMSSWGEQITVSVYDSGAGRSQVQVISATKHFAGSLLSSGKNQKNVDRLVSQTDKVLAQYGAKWSADLGMDQPDSGGTDEVESSGSDEVESRLRRLADLHSKQLVSDEEYQHRRAEIIAEL
jgi:hypothetical protein